MRFMVKIPMPTAEENPIVRDPDFGRALHALYLQLGSQANYSLSQDRRRVDFILIDVEPGGMASVARSIFQLLQVKVEFLPETNPRKSYGHINK
jgi:hypothetical protein